MGIRSGGNVMKLSNSSINTFTTCGHSYNLKYISFRWIDINSKYKTIDIKTHFKECDLIYWFYYLKIF